MKRLLLFLFLVDMVKSTYYDHTITDAKNCCTNKHEHNGYTEQCTRCCEVHLVCVSQVQWIKNIGYLPLCRCLTQAEYQDL